MPPATNPNQHTVATFSLLQKPDVSWAGSPQRASGVEAWVQREMPPIVRQRSAPPQLPRAMTKSQEQAFRLPSASQNGPAAQRASGLSSRTQIAPQDTDLTQWVSPLQGV